MADKKDHGQFFYSTLQRLQAFFDKEETLPDELLPPDSLPNDSPIRKKWEANLFFENLRYAALQEAFRVYDNFVTFLKLKQDALLEEQFFYSHQKTIKPTILTISNVVIKDQVKNQAEQSRNVTELVEKFETLLSFIDHKIEDINNNITKKREEIAATEDHLIDLRKQLFTHWIAHYKTLGSQPLNPLILKTSIPDSFKQLPAAKHYEGVVQIDKNIFSELANEVQYAEEEEFSLNDVYHLIKQKFANKIRTELNDNLLFIPEKDRKNIIDEQLYSDDVQNFINKHSLHGVISNKVLLDFIDKVQHTEKELGVSNLYLETYEKQKEIYESAKLEVAAAVKIATEFKNASVAERENIDKTYDEIIALRTTYNSIAEQINQLENTIPLTLDDYQFVSNNTDSITDAIQSLILETETIEELGIQDPNLLVSFEELQEKRKDLFEAALNQKENVVVESKEIIDENITSPKLR